MSASFTRLTGATTAFHMAAVAEFADEVQWLWPVVFPPEVDGLKVAPSKRSKFYSLDTSSKLHSLKHILFHILTKGPLHQQSTGPFESNNAAIKKKFAFGTQRDDSKTLKQLLLRAETERLLSTHVKVMNEFIAGACDHMLNSHLKRNRFKHGDYSNILPNTLPWAA